MRVDVGERFSAFHVLTLRCDRLALAGDSGDRQSEGGIWRMLQTKFDFNSVFIFRLGGVTGLQVIPVIDKVKEKYTEWFKLN